MARRVAEEEAWDNEEWDRDEDEPTVPCPYCGRQIYEDSPQCPHCQQYISEEDAPPSRKPWWIILGAVLCLLVIWLWSVR